MPEGAMEDIAVMALLLAGTGGRGAASRLRQHGYILSFNGTHAIEGDENEKCMKVVGVSHCEMYELL
jgi:hypothetical protein